MISPFDLAAVFLGLTAVIGWVNTRFLRLPKSIAILMIGAGGAASLLALHSLAPAFVAGLTAPLKTFNFSSTVLNVMLAYLMFAGGMQVEVTALRRSMLPTLLLATLGVVVSTLVIGALFAGAAGLIGAPIGLSWALVLGAIISPTDPVALMAVLRSVVLPPALKAMMQGEALFNDGAGILLFSATATAAAASAAGGHAPGLARLVMDMGREGLGGAALGLAAGGAALLAMRAIDEYGVETGITVALATGVYAVALKLHVSGPIAAAAAGLLIGGPRAESAMSETTRRYVKGFWSLIDDLLNSLLFLMVGLELLDLPMEARLIWSAAVAVPIALLGRLASVLGPSLMITRLKREFGPGTTAILTWGGVRGGLSIALALALPPAPEKPVLLLATYAVAFFSIVVQGLTLGPLARAYGLDRRAGAYEEI
jgi:CPA1 family monovalent cation:H+ antiporter